MYALYVCLICIIIHGHSWSKRACQIYIYIYICIYIYVCIYVCLICMPYMYNNPRALVVEARLPDAFHIHSSEIHSS